MRKFSIVLICAVTMLMISGRCFILQASPLPVVIDSSFTSLQLGPFIEVLRDPTNQLTIQNLVSPRLSNLFQPYSENTFNYGFDSSSYWFRFRLDFVSPFEKQRQMILAVTKHGTPEVDLFVPTKGAPATSFRVLQAGGMHKIGSEDIGYRFTTFILPEDIPNESFIYIRVKTRVANYSISLFSAPAFNRYTRFEYLFFGLTSGIILAMLLYNLVLAIFLKDKVYLIYCVYIGFMGCYVALQTRWPVGFGLNPVTIHSIILNSWALAVFFGFLFSRFFLITKKDHPVIDRIFLLMMGMAASVFFISIANHGLANKIANAIGLGGPIAVIVAASIRWRQGYTPARYYLAAWSTICLASIIFAALNMGFIRYFFLTKNILSVGTSLEVILLSFALADRINTMKKEQTRMKEKERRLTELSITDELTGLFNKRWYSSKLSSEIEHASRLSRHLSLLILDIDHFKKFNDNYGHATGDRVLSKLGKAIAEAVRQSDIPCRYGGEEFCVILPGTNKNESFTIAERLRNDFSLLKVKTDQDGDVSATISIGITSLKRDDTEDTLFERADKALYQAKEQGRNRTIVL